jgi:uncharacterized membrane protein YkvA (DUF1232 family)
MATKLYPVFHHFIKIFASKYLLKINMTLIEKIKSKIRQLKSELNILAISYKDPRTPLLPKIIIGITVAYLLSPIDLIPDFIPILGLIDDLIIVPLLISLSIKLIPKAVLEDARKKTAEQPSLKKNWLAALLIIVIWIASLIVVTKAIWKYF